MMHMNDFTSSKNNFSTSESLGLSGVPSDDYIKLAQKVATLESDLIMKNKQCEQIESLNNDLLEQLESLTAFASVVNEQMKSNNIVLQEGLDTSVKDSIASEIGKLLEEKRSDVYIINGKHSKLAFHIISWFSASVLVVVIILAFINGIFFVIKSISIPT